MGNMLHRDLHLAPVTIIRIKNYVIYVKFRNASVYVVELH